MKWMEVDEMCVMNHRSMIHGAAASEADYKDDMNAVMMFNWTRAAAD